MTTADQTAAPHRVFRIAGQPVATLWPSGRLDWAGDDSRRPPAQGRSASARLLAAIERLVAEELHGRAAGPVTVEAGTAARQM